MLRRSSFAFTALSGLILVVVVIVVACGSLPLAASQSPCNDGAVAIENGQLLFQGCDGKHADLDTLADRTAQLRASETKANALTQTYTAQLDVLQAVDELRNVIRLEHFATTPAEAPAGSVSAAIIGDFLGDGTPCYAAATTSSDNAAPGSLSIFVKARSGSSQISMPSFTAVAHLATMDLNLDGLADLVIVNGTQVVVMLATQVGTAIFSTPIALPDNRVGGETLQTHLIGTKPNIVLASPTLTTLYYNLTDDSASTMPLANNIEEVISGRFSDLTAFDEFLVIKENSEPGYQLSRVLFSADGAIDQVMEMLQGKTIGPMAAVDVDKDGLDEALVVVDERLVLFTFTNKSAEGDVLNRFPRLIVQMLVADLNGDEISDVVCIDEEGLLFWALLSDPAPPKLVMRKADINAKRLAGLADLDNNGLLDLLYITMDGALAQFTTIW
eukprot:m.58173 g.58173  ORF g.58173 m.58173 type:complete len:444 (-) comp7128_c0_seq1:39-1370(-)